MMLEWMFSLQVAGIFARLYPSFVSLSSLPAASAVGWRTGIRTGEVVESHFGGVFFRVVEVLAVVPESCGEGTAVDSYSTGPSGAAA